MMMIMVVMIMMIMMIRFIIKTNLINSPILCNLFKLRQINP